MANAAGNPLPGQPVGAQRAEPPGRPGPEQTSDVAAAGAPSAADGDGAGAGTADALAIAADRLRKAAAAHDDDAAASVQPPG